MGTQGPAGAHLSPDSLNARWRIFPGMVYPEHGLHSSEKRNEIVRGSPCAFCESQTQCLSVRVFAPIAKVSRPQRRSIREQRRQAALEVSARFEQEIADFASSLHHYAGALASEGSPFFEPQTWPDH